MGFSVVAGINPIRKKKIDIFIEAQEKRKKLSDRSIQIAADKTANG